MTKRKTSQNNPSPVDRCAAQHFGPWMVHAEWFSQAVAAVKDGSFSSEDRHLSPDAIERAVSAMGDDVEYEVSGDCVYVLYYIENGIARIPMSGQVTKGDSSFGGFSSVRARRAVRKAASDDRVSEILLHIDSPGGTVSGTGDLADDIATADDLKPVYTYFEDLGASAAYWIGCQARRVFANPTAQVGSIGTMTYVEDTSGAYEKAGIKVTLIATGKYKGQWIDGNPVSEDYIQSVRDEVNDLNEHFLSGVMQGRGMSREALMNVADGRCFIADKAKNFGLIDDVSTLDAAVGAIISERNSRMTPEAFKAYAAEHPEAVAGYIEQGYTQAKGDLKPKVATVSDLESAFPGQSDFIVAQLKTGATLAEANAAAVKAMVAEKSATEQAHVAALAAKDLTIADRQAEIKRLQFAAEGQKPVNTNGSSGEGGAPATGSQDEPEVKAKEEWKSNKDDCQSTFASEDIYVRARKRELTRPA